MKIYKVLLTLFVLLFNIQNVFAQYQMILQNDIKVDAKTLQFDICIVSTGDNFNLTSYSLAITYNDAIVNGGALTFKYNEGSTELNFSPAKTIILKDAGISKLLCGSNPGIQSISNTPIKIGTYTLSNTAEFGHTPFDIAWNFSGNFGSLLNINNVPSIIKENFINNLTSKESNVTSVASQKIPTEFVLHQNYPNPFNPSTKIKFDLPKESKVTLKIYNIIGEEVATLVNNVISEGFHEVTFNAAKLSSGIYIYRIEAISSGNQSGNMIQVRKMILMK